MPTGVPRGLLGYCERTMALKAVLFDAGNTVMMINYAVVSQILLSEGIDAHVEQVRRAEYRARVQIDPILALRQSTEAPQVFRTYFHFIFEGLGLSRGPAEERAFRRIAEYNRMHNLWDQPNPQARPVLEELRGRGITVGMISNSDGTIERIIAQRGLAPYFRFVLDSHVVGVEKPDPRIFRMALDRADAGPHEAVYIGDLYSIDVLGSRGVGMDAILLDPGDVWGDRDCVKVTDLAEATTVVMQRFGSGL
jgi:HAD superfamily hydrolase (TIGR01509 family)